MDFRSEYCLGISALFINLKRNSLCQIGTIQAHSRDLSNVQPAADAPTLSRPLVFQEI